MLWPRLQRRFPADAAYLRPDQLLRGVAAFLAAPRLLHLSEMVGASPAGGRAALQRPDFERWLEGEGPALHSPPLGGG